MLSARDMCALATEDISNNKFLTEIEAQCKEEAKKHNKFFTELFQVQDKHTDLQMLIIKHYNVDTYRALTRLGYLFGVVTDEDDMKHIYIGWGYTNVSDLEADLRKIE